MKFILDNMSTKRKRHYTVEEALEMILDDEEI